MRELSEYERKSLRKLGESIHQGKWSNDGLVQLVELVIDFLNPVPLLQYGKENGISYNGLKKQNKAITLLNQKYIIDNE